MKRLARHLALATLIGAVGALLITTSASSSPTQYTITDLGPGYAVAINQAGDVAGYYGGTSFLYKDGQATTNIDIIAAGVNDLAQVVGYSWLVAGGTSYHAVAYDNGSISDLGTLGGAFSTGTAINAAGQIVGEAEGPNRAWAHAFVYSGGQMTDLGTLGGGRSAAHAINDVGQIVGESTLSGTPYIGFGTNQQVTHAVLWDHGSMRDLGTFGGFGSTANDINVHGDVAGAVFTPIGVGPGKPHPALFSGGVMRDLGTLGGDQGAAYGINAAGQIVGYSYNSDIYTPEGGEVHAFVYEDGAMWDLQDLIPADADWRILWVAMDINDAGQIAGYGVRNGGVHGFLLTPLNPDTPPAITSSASSTFMLGGPNTFTIATTGRPAPVITLSGTLPAGLTFHDNGDGTATLNGTPAAGTAGSYPLTVTAANGVTSDAVQAFTLNVSYVFHGFFQPLDNGDIFNVVNAGRTIPVKFDLNGDQGFNILAAGYPRSVTTSCAAAAPQDVVEETVTGDQTSLHYDASVNAPVGQYTYNWKTDKGWAGTCRELQFKFVDGVVYKSNMRFTR